MHTSFIRVWLHKFVKCYLVNVVEEAEGGEGSSQAPQNGDDAHRQEIKFEVVQRREDEGGLILEHETLLG